jgi:hypothetical protein
MALSWDKQPASRIITSSVFTLTTSAQVTGAFGAQTYQIRVATTGGVGTAGCFVKIGDGTVTASTGNDAVIGTNVTDYFNCTPGQKASVIGGVAGGTVTVSEMA